MAKIRLKPIGTQQILSEKAPGSYQDFQSTNLFSGYFHATRV